MFFFIDKCHIYIHQAVATGSTTPSSAMPSWPGPVVMPPRCGTRSRDVPRRDVGGEKQRPVDLAIFDDFCCCHMALWLNCMCIFTCFNKIHDFCCRFQIYSYRYVYWYVLEAAVPCYHFPPPLRSELAAQRFPKCQLDGFLHAPRGRAAPFRSSIASGHIGQPNKVSDVSEQY